LQSHDIYGRQFKTTTHRAARLITVSKMVISKASAFMVKLAKDNDTARAVILRNQADRPLDRKLAAAAAARPASDAELSFGVKVD
jgi:hypothetical protein